MYKIIKDVIDTKGFKLEEMLYKINKMYIEARISESEKAELDNLARENAKAENSFDIQRQIDELRLRIEALENKEETIEDVEEYSIFKQPTGAHDVYNTGDKVTFNDKKYICKMDNCAWSPDIYPAGWEEVVESEG